MAENTEQDRLRSKHWRARFHGPRDERSRILREINRSSRRNSERRRDILMVAGLFAFAFALAAALFWLGAEVLAR